MQNFFRFFSAIILIFFCTNIYSQQSKVFPTKGTVFWLGFVENYDVEPTVRLDVFITSDRNTTGTISIPAQSYTRSFAVTANQTTTVTIPTSSGIHTSTETIDNKGIIIQTQDTVSVYAINFDEYTADGTLVLPANSLGIDYRITSYRGISNEYYYSNAVIVATEDNTQIEIIPSTNTLGGKTAGSTYTINLNAGQSYQLKASTASGDLTGTIIRGSTQSGSCRPFAVFSGSMCTNIPVGCTACDVLFEQEYPTNIWGKEYLITPFSFASSYTYKVLANTDGTVFTINNGASINLNAGQSYEANNVSGTVYIASNNKVSVTQFMQGVTCSGAGDPSQLALNPIDQMLNGITFSTVTSTVITQHNVNVIMKSTFINQLTLDGTPINSSSFISFASNPIYSYAQLSLTQGSHTLKADSGFIAYAYGTGSAESYAYALGSFMEENTIPTDTVTIYCTSSPITLTPAEVLNFPQWTSDANPDSIISTSQTITFTPTTSNIYTYTGFSQISGCPKTYRFFVELPLPPHITSTQSTDSICKFGQVKFNLDVLPYSPSYTYSWAPTTGLSDASIPNPVATPPQSMWYYCTVSTPGGCGTSTDSIYIAVRPGNISKVQITADQTEFCLGDSAQLNLFVEKVIFQDSIGSSYNASIWSSVSGGAASTACGSVSGNAFYFNGSGSRFAATNSLNVTGGGTVYFYLKIANGTAPCDNADPGEDIVLEYSINGGTSWTTFATYSENKYPDFNFISVSIPNPAKTTATRFRWRQLSNSGAGQDNWAIDGIYIGALSNSDFTFNWSPSSNLSDANIMNPVATPDSVRMYYAIVVDTLTGCTYSDSVFIDVGQPFTLNVSEDDTVCQLSGISLFVTPSHSGTYTYQWTPSASLSDSSSATPVATPTSTTTYYVNVESSQHCSATDSVKIHVPLISLFYTSPHQDSLCEGQSLQINATYQKMCGANGTVCSGTIDTVQLGTATTTTSSNNGTLYNGNNLSSRFQLLFTKAELNALGITQATTITEIGFRIGSIAGSNIYQNFTIKMGCTDLSTLSSAYVTGLATVFNPKNVIIINNVVYYVLDNTFDWDGTTNIIVEVCYKNSVTSANSSTYYTNSSFNSFLAKSSASACNEATGTLSMNRPNTYFKFCNSPTLNNLDFLWSPSTWLSDSTIPNPVATPVSSIVYYLTATDSITGCVYSDSVQISAGPVFTVSAPDSILNCNTQGIQISATPSIAGNYTYNWFPSSSLSSSTISNPVAAPTSTTQYYVSVTSEYGCTVEDTATVIVPALATFYVTPALDTICSGQSVQLNTVFQQGCGVNGSTCAGAASPLQVGTGTSSSFSGSVTIYKGASNGSKIQLLYRKSELNAAGLNSAATLSEIGFNIASIVGSNIYQNFTIKMGCTSQTSLTTTFQEGLQTVLNPKNVILTSGVNYYNFDYTFDWDGNSNIIVEICFNNAVTSANSSVYYSTTSYNSVTYTTGTSSVCSNVTGTTSTSRANTYFKYCSADAGDNLTIQWTPSIGLNNDTISNPVASPTVNTMYYITAIDSSTGCVFNDSVLIEADINSVLVLGNDTIICSGDSIVFNAGSNYRSYTWNDGTTDSVKIASSSGVYWVEVSNACGVQRDSVVLTVNEKPANFSIGNDTTICNGSQVVLNVYNPDYISYLWQGGSTDSVFTAINQGLYRVTIQTLCGTATDSMYLSVQYPIPVNLGNDTTLCPGNTLDLDAGNGYNSYLWQDSSTASTFTAQNSGAYYVVATNVCGSYNDSIIVNYDSLPSVDLGNDTTICNGSQIVLNVYDVKTLSYLWQDGSVDSSFTATNQGLYRVTVQALCGTATDSMYLSVQYPIPVNLGNDTTLCPGSTLDLDAGNGYNSYLWQDSSTASTFTAQNSGAYYVVATNVCGSYNDSIIVNYDSLPSVDLGNDTTICNGSQIVLNVYDVKTMSYLWQDDSVDSSFTATNQGLYKVTVQALCGTATDSMYLSIQYPIPVNLGNDTILCPGNTLALDAGSGYNSYLWQDSSTASTFTVQNTGTYYVVATNVCGSYSDTITVNYDSLPSVDLGNDTTICNGSQIVLNVYDVKTISYLWQDGSVDSSFTATNQGLYKVTVQALCGTATDSMYLSIQYPIPVNLGNDTTLCSGNTLDLDAGNGYNSYLWQDSSTASTFTVQNSGTYYVVATNVCGSYSDTIIVNYDSLPSVDLGNDTTICPGDTVSLVAGNCPDCNFIWQDGSINPVYTAALSGLYYINATNLCGSDKDSIYISQLKLPEVSLGNDTSFCFGSLITVAAQSQTGYQYLWHDGSMDSSVTVSAAGPYWVKVTNSCGSVTDILTVISVYPLPEIFLGNDTMFCENDTIRLNAAHPGYTCLWQDSSAASEYMATTAGIYWVLVTDSNACRSVDSVFISGSPVPYISLGNDASLCMGEEVFLKLPDDKNYFYVWQDGSTLNYYSVRDTGLYYVTASDSCSSYTDSIYFSRTDCQCFIDVPSAFSPNGDGRNDILYLRGYCAGNIDFYVYDRWGQKVFESHDLSTGWDGTFNGKKMDTAVFVFYLSGGSSDNGKEKVLKKGNISLIR